MHSCRHWRSLLRVLRCAGRSASSSSLLQDDLNGPILDTRLRKKKKCSCSTSKVTAEKEKEQSNKVISFEQSHMLLNDKVDADEGVRIRITRRVQTD